MKNVKLSLNIHVLKSKLHNITSRKIPLIRLGRIYGQWRNLMSLCSGEGVGEGGTYIQERGLEGGGLYSGGKKLSLAIC